MKGVDKSLVGIVAAVAVIAVVAMVVAVNRGSTISYRTDDTPDGVAFNYLLALQRSDHARAYGCVSPSIKNYPASVEAFASTIENSYPLSGNRDVALEIESLRTENDQAWVKVRETVYFRTGPFGSDQYAYTFQMALQREAPGWRITDSDNYWARSWRKPSH